MFKDLSNYIVGTAVAVTTTFAVWYTNVADKVKGPEPGTEQWMVYQEERYKNLRSDILDLKYQLTQTTDWDTLTNLKFTLSNVRTACVETATNYNKYSDTIPGNKRLNAEDCQR